MNHACRDDTAMSPAQVGGPIGRPRRAASVAGVSPVGTARPMSPEPSPRTSPAQVRTGALRPAAIGAPCQGPFYCRPHLRPDEHGGRRRSRRVGGGNAADAFGLVDGRRWRVSDEALGGSAGCGRVRKVDGRGGDGRSSGVDGRGREEWDGVVGRVRRVANRSVDICHCVAASAPAAPPPARPGSRRSRGC